MCDEEITCAMLSKVNDFYLLNLMDECFGLDNELPKLEVLIVKIREGSLKTKNFETKTTLI